MVWIRTQWKFQVVKAGSYFGVGERALPESGNCAQASFVILSTEHCLEGQQILKAFTPFPGIALQGETCGAVIGSLIALGLGYGRDDMHD